MMRPAHHFVRPPQRGVAAVELAVLLPILVVLLTVPLFYGRYLWHYTVANKAAQDAARYLSTISVKEMRTRALAEAADAVAKDIAREEMDDLNPGGDTLVVTYCGTNAFGTPRPCAGVGSNPLPQTVIVSVELAMVDNIFRVVPTGIYGMPLVAQAEMRYVPK